MGHAYKHHWSSVLLHFEEDWLHFEDWLQRPEGKPQAAAIAIAMHDWSLVITNGIGFVKFDKIYCSVSAHSSYMLHAGVVSGANSRRVIGGLVDQDFRVGSMQKLQIFGPPFLHNPRNNGCPKGRRCPPWSHNGCPSRSRSPRLRVEVSKLSPLQGCPALCHRSWVAPTSGWVTRRVGAPVSRCMKTYF